MTSGKAARRLRQQSPKKTTTRLHPPTVQAYTQGLPLAAGGAQLRFARPEDMPVIATLMAAAGANVTEGLTKALNVGQLAGNVKDGLAGGRESFMRSLAASFQGGSDPFFACSAALVVEEGGAVVAAAVAGPPGGYLQKVGDLVPGKEGMRLMMMGVMGTAKLIGVATHPEHQGRGYGVALVRHLRSIFVRCGYFIMYGSFEVSKPYLERFYSQLGFEVLPSGQAVDFSLVLDRPGGPVPEAGERMFVDARLPDRSAIP